MHSVKHKNTIDLDDVSTFATVSPSMNSFKYAEGRGERGEGRYRGERGEGRGERGEGRGERRERERGVKGRGGERGKADMRKRAKPKLTDSLDK